MGKPESNVVELILAVDLDPSNPEEPINVGDVKVSPKGGENETETTLIGELLEAVAKLDPDYAMAIGEAGKDNPRAAVRALQKLADKAPEDAQDEADPFDKAMGHDKMMKPKDPEDRYGKSKAPDDFKPKRREPEDDDEGEDDFEPKKSGGFKGASDRAFGKKSDFGEREPFEKKKKFDDDEDERF